VYFTGNTAAIEKVKRSGGPCGMQEAAGFFAGRKRVRKRPRSRHAKSGEARSTAINCRITGKQLELQIGNAIGAKPLRRLGFPSDGWATGPIQQQQAANVQALEFRHRLTLFDVRHSPCHRGNRRHFRRNDRR
jgi:hypothetical protein